jgi:hypothetical protein
VRSAFRWERPCASGVDEVWGCARDERGDLLVVEEKFALPVYPTASGAHISTTDDPEHPDVIDDVVDDVIEEVLAARGRVVVVQDGDLAHLGQIALALR